MEKKPSPEQIRADLINKNEEPKISSFVQLKCDDRLTWLCSENICHSGKAVFAYYDNLTGQIHKMGIFY